MITWSINALVDHKVEVDARVLIYSSLLYTLAIVHDTQLAIGLPVIRAIER